MATLPTTDSDPSDEIDLSIDNDSEILELLNVEYVGNDVLMFSQEQLEAALEFALTDETREKLAKMIEVARANKGTGIFNVW